MQIATISLILDFSDSKCLWRASVKYSEKWNENGKQKFLTRGVREMSGQFYFGENNLQILPRTLANT